MSIEGTENCLEAAVKGFEGTFALLETAEGAVFRWPIKKLPDDIHEGSPVRITLSTELNEVKAREKLAREMLNQLLRPS